jgi:hypothetical protein
MTGEALEHPDRVLGVAGFADDFFTEHNHGVRPQDPAPGACLQGVRHGSGLGLGQANDQGLRAFAGQNLLVDIRRANLELEARLGKQGPAPRRAAGQNEPTRRKGGGSMSRGIGDGEGFRGLA